jgi:hypothetical protein
MKDAASVSALACPAGQTQSIVSFLCKSASAATCFARVDNDIFDGAEPIIFLDTVFSVQGLPSLNMLLLLYRFHFGGGSNGQPALMQSLLTQHGTLTIGHPGCDAAVARQDQQAAESARWQGQYQETSPTSEIGDKTRR